MRSIVAITLLLAAVACQKGAAPVAGGAASRQPPEPALVRPATESAAFHLEIAGIHERFQDPKGALEHATQAVGLAEEGAERIRALSTLGRLKEASNDRDGAIDALTRASTERARANASPAAARQVGPGAAPGDDDVDLRLARLHLEKGDYRKALETCRSASVAAQNPWQRDAVLRLDVEVHRRAGTLDKRIAEAEGALADKKPDEASLRFLIAAAGGNSGPPSPAAPVGAIMPNQQPPVSPKVIQAHERLLELHPGDFQLRQALQGLLERAGRIDEAVGVARAAPLADPMECSGGAAPYPASPALQRSVEIARLRQRAGQGDKALQEAALLEASARQEGVLAYLTAADLYLELGSDARAAAAIGKAKAGARSRHERRQAALAQRRLLERSGKAAELKALQADWTRSEDPCLRLAAADAGTAALPSPAPLPLP